MGFSSNTSLFLTFLFLFAITEATDFLVGGSNTAWKIPSSSSDSLNKWAEANRFQIGDSLVWKFDGAKDSVLQVSREDYLSCNTSNPVAEPQNKDQTVTVKLDRHGAFYFISGAKGACQKGEKLIVVVMAKRRISAVSPAPSPAESDSPEIAPMAGGGSPVVRGLGAALVALAVVMMGFVV